MAIRLAPLLSALISFGTVVLIGPKAISYLQRFKLGQRIREDGPKSHRDKAGTPTMGGLVIVFGIVIGVLVFRPLTHNSVIMLFATVGFAGVGFLDDFIKIAAKRSLGLRAREKLVAQFGLALLVAFYAAARVGTDLVVPFSQKSLHLPAFLYIPLAVLAVVGTANAVNLTDGLDGLAAGSTAISSAALGLVAMYFGHPDLALFAGALSGACLGFSWFNAPPAQLFMGDTGSLALGAALAALALLTKTPLVLAIIGGLFVIETLSVIVQVTYFRLTRGGRFFRMAPLHHHFELVGLAESTIMIRFWLIALIFAVVGLLAVF